MSLAVSSSAFAQNAEIPSQVHLRRGQDASPPLCVERRARTTKSFALIVDDPDAPDPAAPKMTYVHWVLYDLPGHVTSLDEDARSNCHAGARKA
jgi:phosphatidylethanolamine-binding protein (PEBP) family uncharacterized protein